MYMALSFFRRCVFQRLFLFGGVMVIVSFTPELDYATWRLRKAMQNKSAVERYEKRDTIARQMWVDFEKEERAKRYRKSIR